MHLTDEYMSYPNFPCLHINNGLIISANDRFTDLTGLTKNDVLNKSLSYVFLNVLKAKSSIIDFDKLQYNADCLIFTPNSGAMDVSIVPFCEDGSSYIKLVQRYNAIIGDKFEFLEQICGDNTAVAFFNTSDFTLLKANSVFLGYINKNLHTDENPFGYPISSFLPEWKDNFYERSIRKILLYGKSYNNSEFLYKSRLKGITFWDLTLVPIMFNNKVEYFSLIAKDITEAVLSRKTLEKRLKVVQKKNNRFQKIFDNMSDGIYVEDYENKTVSVNKVTRDFFDSIGLKGKLPEEIRNAKCYDKNGREIPERELPITKLQKQGKYEHSIYTLKYENKEIHLCISGIPVYDSNNKLNMALLCVKIMTDKINQEKELLLQRDLYYNIFDLLGLPIVYLSYPNLEIYRINRNAKDLIMKTIEPTKSSSKYNYSQDPQFFGAQMIKLKPFLNIDSGVFHKLIKEIKNKKEPVYYNVEINSCSLKCTYKMVVQPICDIEGSVIEVIITGIDITYEMAQQENLEKMAQMKDEFVYSITHEFKTPLTVINSAIQTLESIYKDELTDNVKKYIGKIKQNSFRQLRLVNNLLEANKMSMGKIFINKKNLDIVSLTRIIIESVQAYAQQKGINLIFLTALKEKSISIDDEKYERVLLNLLSNAIKFTPKGKKIVVKVSLKIKNKKQKVRIIVQDEGIGIPKDKLKLIFERFWQVDSSLTRNTEGTGLGLSIVKQLVEVLEGEIHVSSKVGVGSSFELLLPADQVDNKPQEIDTKQLIDNHLIHSTAIEFSDIYL